jgi:exonuclease SbcD
MTRIAFTADLHVDEYGSRRDPETGLNARLLDFLSTTRWMAEEADRRGAYALVVAGDFTERRHPAPWLVTRIRNALSFGPGRQLYVRGNHDGEIAGGSTVSVLDDGYEEHDESGRSSVSQPRLEPIAFDAVLACVPFLDRHWLRAQPGFESVPDAELFKVLGDQFLAIAGGLYAEARRDYPDAGVVLVCHQTLAGGRMGPAQEAFLGDVSLVIDTRALASIGFEAVVAGHLHQHQVLVDGDRPVLYTGSPERVDFGEEAETKGFVVADVGPGRFAWEFVETPARRFVTIDASNWPQSEHGGPDSQILQDAVVRVVNLPPEDDVAQVRRTLEDLGAFDVTEIRRRALPQAGSAGGLSESLTAGEALTEYFAGDPDAEALVELGGRILVEATS